MYGNVPIFLPAATASIREDVFYMESRVALPPLKLPLVVQLYGISEETLRAYEAEGLISPLRAGNDAFYTKRDRIRIEVILKGRALGFSLRDIKLILNAHIPKTGNRLLRDVQIQQQVEQLKAEKAALQIAIDHLQAQVADDDPD